ncbi:hypothetical protein CC80DRAFT_491026 [Byssothecium circinans]|uniref:Uncharacterized protein n=1 Tax=Byssothecium circinans TaxID=147558 RepID=A0A6A5U0M5_9PLEO|nr:hypothetical protein CC80DRAFT_491026 [Byssothecium circinans]
MKAHVRSYCHLDLVSKGEVNAAGLEKLAQTIGKPVGDFVQQLLDPQTRETAISLFMAYTILGTCIVPKGGESTASYRRWKALTGTILSEEDPNEVLSMTRTEILEEIDRVLAPFVLGSLDGGHRRRHLDLMLDQAERLIILLFSQPGAYRLDYGLDGRTILPPFPSLLQTADEKRALDFPRVLVGTEDGDWWYLAE